MEIKKAKILVVEDSTTMRDLISAYLRDIGFRTIYPAGNGLQALPYLDQVHMVICDWDMPEMNGLELLTKIRSIPDTAHLPFLMLTAVSNKMQVAEAVKAGVSDYLSKPFQPKQLTDRVSRIINGIKPSVKPTPDFQDLTDM